MAKTIVLKRFNIMYEGEIYGPKTENGPVIENVKDELADKLIRESNGDITEQPQAKKASKAPAQTKSAQQEASADSDLSNELAEYKKQAKQMTEAEVSELRDKAKDLGITSYHNKGVAKLLKEVEEASRPGLPPLEPDEDEDE